MRIRVTDPPTYNRVHAPHRADPSAARCVGRRPERPRGTLEQLFHHRHTQQVGQGGAFGESRVHRAGRREVRLPAGRALAHAESDPRRRRGRRRARGRARADQVQSPGDHPGDGHDLGEAIQEEDRGQDAHARGVREAQVRRSRAGHQAGPHQGKGRAHHRRRVQGRGRRSPPQVQGSGHQVAPPQETGGSWRGSVGHG